MQKYNKEKKLYKKTNKLLNLSINYTEEFYKIIYLIKMNMEFCVTNLLSIWMKRKMNVLYKFEHKKKFFFSHNKLKFNLESRS